MESKKKVVELNVDDILPNRFQPRIKFDETAINDLADSIKEHGVIQPIVVRKIGDKYEIIAGERRYKATTIAGLETIPAIITELNDKDSAEVALIENVQRQNLTPIEEAVSYKKILDMGYLTQEQLASKLGKSQSAIANKLRLLNLDDEVQEALLNGEISERHARSLLKLSNSKQQIEMLNRIIDERLTVRKTDEEIDKMLNDLFESSDEVEEKEDLDVSNEVEKEEEIEHTQPLNFNFGNDYQEEKENVFDTNDEAKESANESTDFYGFNQNFDNDNVFDIGVNNPVDIDTEEKENVFDMNDDAKEPTDFYGFNQNFDNDENEPTDFFGFNQNLMNDDSSVKDEYSLNNNDFVDVNKIEEEAQDLYPKEETKDINSFLEPTLLINDDDDVETNIEQEETKEEVNNEENELTSVEEPVNDVEPIQNENIELDEERRPGKFFNLFNNFDVDEPVNDNSFENQNNIDTTQEQVNSNIFNSEDNIEPVQDNVELEQDEELSEVVPQKLEAEDVNIDTPVSNENNNINLALEKIKEYASELKKLGIDMNIEESDFENKYQITINIDK